MHNSIKLEEADKIASLLPALMRRLFTLDDDLAVDLPLAQLRVCAILQDGPRPMSVIGRELRVTLSAMTQIADRLQRAKLVDRVADKSDRRIRCLQLTPHGEKMMRRRDNSRIQNVSAVLNYMSPGARRDILAALDMLMEASTVLKKQNDSNANPLAGSNHRPEKLLMTKVIS